MGYVKRGFAVAGMLLVVGCASLTDKTLPLNDEVLIYELPYDLTFLRTVEAVQETPGWELEETEKERGIVRVRNLEFKHFDDADKRMITILVKRDSRNQTSIKLSPESQRVLGGGQILETVAGYVAKEIR